MNTIEKLNLILAEAVQVFDLYGYKKPL